MKVLLYGGSFDPPHHGHIALLSAALKELNPSHAHVFPTYRSPLKANPPAAEIHRLNMMRLALQGLPARQKRIVRLDPYEIRRKRTTYTHETVRYLRRLYPEAELWVLVGSDTFASFPCWKRPEKLRTLCRWIIGRRPNQPISPLQGRKFPKARILPGVFPKICSNEIRCQLLCGGDVSSQLDRHVLDYIRRHRLYGWMYHQWLRQALRPKRYQHTLCVAKNASELARKHGLNPERAALAGLLHDCGRSFPPRQLVRYALRRKLKIPGLKRIARHNPILLHAHISADLAQRRFGIKDLGVLSAIRKHTLGDIFMSPLDQLLYVADASSSDRAFREAAKIRAIAQYDLREAMKQIVGVKLRYALKKESWLHPLGVTLWNQMLEGHMTDAAP